MRNLSAAAAACAMALAGFAGLAGASASVDLIWIDVSATNLMGNPICLLPANRNCPPDPRSPDGGVTISSVFVTDNITLGVILTAGPNGSIGAGVSVNYGDAIPKLGVVDFRSLATTQPFVYLPLQIGATTDRSPYIDNINAAAAPPLGNGIGLPPGASAYLGTVTFHKDIVVNGSFEIGVGLDGPGGTDGVLDGSGNSIGGTTTFNSAFLVNVNGTTPPSPTPTPTPTATATPTPTPTGTPGTPTPTATPAARCEDRWPITSITTIAKGQSPANNVKVIHTITGNIIDPGAVCRESGVCTAQRIPVCAGTAVNAAVEGSTNNTNIGKGVIACDAAGCSVAAIEVTEKYKSVSADGKDTDRVTLLPQ